MPNHSLPSMGLMMAATMSVTNVLTDVARKRALHGRELIPATFWIRTAVAAVFGFVLLWRIAVSGNPVEIRDGGPLFGIASLRLTPIATFFIYLEQS